MPRPGGSHLTGALRVLLGAMHAVAIPFIALGVFFGWMWRRHRQSWLDRVSAKGRFKAAKAVHRREFVYSAGVTLIAFLVVRALV